MNEFIEQYNVLTSIPFIGSLAKSFDEKVGEVGIRDAMKYLSDRTKSKIILHTNADVDKILDSSPVVIAANHPFEMEMIPLIAILPNREDISVIAASELTSIGPHTDRHIIPVFIETESLEEHDKLSVRIKTLFNLGPRLILNFEHPRNIESIKNASVRVQQGGIVIVFPSGVRKDGRKWFPGIGYLLSNIGKNNTAYYIKAYIKGTTKFDVLRLIPGIRRLFPSFSVTLSSPQKISEILDTEEDGKQITNKLQNEYNKWVASLGY